MHKLILYLLLPTITLFAKSVDYSVVLNETLKNNEKIKTKKLDIDLAKLDTKKVQSFSYGKLELNHEMSRTNHSGYVFNSKLSSREATFDDFGAAEFVGPNSLQVEPKNLNYPDSRNNFNTKLSYEIPLFTGFKLSTQEEILKIQEKVQELQLNLDEKSIEFEVLKAYNGAVVAKEFINATLKAKEAVSYFVKSADEFYNEGLVTKIDKKQAKVHELNIQSKITEAQNRFELSLAYLKFLTANNDISDVKDLMTFDINKVENEKLENIALENRDDIKIVEEYKNSMKKSIDLANSDYYPNIYSYVEYGMNDDKLSLSSDKDYYMAMLGIKYTLFDNSRDIEKQKSKIAFNKAQLNQNQLKRAIALEVEKAILELNAKEKVYKEKIEAKQLAYEILEQSKLMYKNQLISMTELLKQEASFRENEASMIMAKFNLSLAQAKLYHSIGKSLK